MAQLRDVTTSELIAEGTPERVALIARELGFEQVLFDDVGDAFDPQAVIDAHAERLDALRTFAASEDAPPAAQRTVEAEEEALDAVPIAAEAAQAELDQARDRVA